MFGLLGGFPESIKIGFIKVVHTVRFTLRYVFMLMLVISSLLFHLLFFFNPHPRTCLLVLESREGRERERKKHPWETETLISCLLYIPRLGAEPTP